MAARRWMALLMLAAVFAVHGVQCSGGADTVGYPAPTEHVATAAHVGSVAITALTPGPARAAAGVAGIDDPMTAHTTAARPVAAAAVAGADHGGAPHDWAAHLWTACLAVLVFALAVLGRLLVRRRVRLERPALRSASARGWLTPLRPPDLHALCLLRT